MAYTPTLWAKGDIVTSEKLNKIEQGIVDKVDKVNGKTLSTNDYTNEDKAKLNSLESQIDHLESLVGSPLVASTAAEMTDEDKVYVYTGSETGYQNGNWYYYNGTTWTSGGVYNSVAFETDDTLSTQGMAADAKKTGDELLDLKEDLRSDYSELSAEVNGTINVRHCKNLFNENDEDVLVGYYLNAGTGEVTTNTSRSVSGYFPVIAGKYLTFSSADYLMRRIAYNMPSICFFDANKAAVSGGATWKTNLIVPNNAVYARICYAKGQAVLMAELTDDGVFTIPYEAFYEPIYRINTDVIIPKSPMGYMRVTGDLADGDEIHVLENNVKNNVCVVFTANVTAFNKLCIGQRSGATWKSCYLEIDSTNLIIHTDQGDISFAHGLTIGSDIQILIETHHNVATSLIRICSDGNVYDDTQPHRWLCDSGYSAVVSSGSTLTDCVLSWTSKNINNPIWIFGDSYVSLYPQRWVYYLLQDGFDSPMINGYAGQDIKDAMKSLNNLLTAQKPQYIFWILGMNNADSSTSTNDTWQVNYDDLTNLCEKLGITLILGTIPTTPRANNDFKNAIIRNSGYRYVDFANAVDPDGDGTWISGLLSDDNVHPTELGAKVLYHKALADFPELMSY